MPPRKQQADEPSLDEILDELSDDELEEYVASRKKTGTKSKGSKADRVTILEGSHAKDWMKSFGLASGDDDDDEEDDDEPPKKRRGYFAR